MKTIQEMSDRQLLEFIFGAQTVLMGKIDRIEAHLEKENHEYIQRDSRDYNEVYQDLKKNIEDLKRQIDSNARIQKDN